MIRWWVYTQPNPRYHCVNLIKIGWSDMKNNEIHSTSHHSFLQFSFFQFRVYIVEWNEISQSYNYSFAFVFYFYVIYSHLFLLLIFFQVSTHKWRSIWQPRLSFRVITHKLMIFIYVRSENKWLWWRSFFFLSKNEYHFFETF